ncbi:MAG: hypothetical protein SO442_11200 [Prevotella sp.]|nr:hypothetical protein [Prevotella sp.]MDY4667843.1 hypothetical protein [Prevotella sp.]
MKSKKMFLGCLGILVAASLVSCGSDDDTPNDNGNGQTTSYVWSTDAGVQACDHLLFSNGKEDPTGTEIGNGNKEFVFKGKQTLKEGKYLLRGWVYVANGSELTIEPGTIIKGEKATQAAIIVEPGGKIIAQGTADKPIVFTSAQAKGSRRPGDWGGIILCGKARNNQSDMQIEGGPRTHHGGTNDDDNSGILEYVRIEFAGYPFQKDKEINGLTLGSVGRGTTIDHVQVSYSNDDSFEWFGGTVNCKYLIAYKGWDDDFDTDNGFSGNVQFGLSVRDPKIADGSQSNGFESDNCADGTAIDPYTTATFSNMTFLGPKFFDNNFQNTTDYITGGSMNPNNGSSLGKFQAAMHIRRNSRLNCYNSLALGWPIGLILDNEKGDTQGAATKKLMRLNNIVFAGMTITGSDYNKIYEDALYDYTTKKTDSSKPSFSSSYFQQADNNNTLLTDWSALKISSSDFLPAAGSSLFSYPVSFSNLSTSFFNKVNYVGCFAQNDTWTKGWTNFDPENTDY